ncbi:MAG: class IV adenylate cyclase [Candidatus Saccharimonadaceae bacterium]
MREIEVKARVTSLATIIEALNQQGKVVSEPVTQHDVVYGVAGVDGGGENSAPWLRIRSETKNDAVTHYFTLKKSITNQLDSIEHETIVADEKELKSIIENLNFELYSDITKTRQKAHLGEIEICLDYIEGLGSFVEAEKLTSEDIDYALVVEELWGLLESIGVLRSDEVTDGYDVLMNKHLAATSA